LRTPARCDACSVGLLDDSAFCHGCGRPVDGALPAAAGERKRITVLFIDAFGSIGLDSRLDAEQWHDVMESFFAVVSTAAQHHGGTIDRLTGEGIKILFGAPLAIESHATHACHAALQIRDRLGELAASVRARAGVEFDVRMGMHSGEAVFGRIDGGERGGSGFTSQGHTAALAARMQQVAAPGRIYVTGDTAELVADYFALHELGELSVRNASRRVHAFELLASRPDRTRLDAARDRGLSPLLGRERELAALEEALRDTTKRGVRIVGVVGEPGIGKSRLVEEFAARHRARGVPVHVAHCAEHARWILFHTTVPFLRAILGVRSSDAPETVRARIVEVLDALDPALLDTLPVLLAALRIASPEEAARATASSAPALELARVVRTWIARHRTTAPTIFVIDDHHWMDPGADALFAEMVRRPPHAPVMVVVTYRRGHERRWMQLPHFRELALRPLGDATALELVQAVMGEDRSLRALQARIVERAAGNPFFVEETILALAAGGVIEGQPGAYRLRASDTEVRLPDSLYAVLAARIDRLAEHEKTVLQAAAVIGRDFAVGLLGAITGRDADGLARVLQSLESGEFVSAVGWGEDQRYHFRHPLLQQTAYGTLLRDHRVELHRRAAAALTQPHGTQGNPHAASIALHSEAAGDDLAAARWHRRAARQTLGWDPGQSYTHWRRVLQCTERIHDDAGARIRLTACEAIVRLGFHQGLAVDEAERLVDEGRRIAQGLGNVQMLARLSLAIGSLRGSTGDLEAGIADQREALQHAVQIRDPGFTLMTGALLLLSLRTAGRIDEGLQLAATLLERHRGDDRGTLGADLVWLRQVALVRAVLLLDRGRLDDGAAELTRVISALRDEDAPLAYAWALSATGMVVRFTGDASPLLAARIEDAHTRALKLAVPSLLGRTTCALATLRLAQDRWQEAHACAVEATAALHELGHSFFIDPDPHLVLSYARFGLGDLTGARAAASEALQRAFQSGARLAQIDALLALGRLQVRYGKLDEIRLAHAMLRHGLALVRRCRARSRAPLFWLELAGLQRRNGDERRAIACQRRGIRQLIAMNAYGHLPRTPGMTNVLDDRAPRLDQETR
jgi:class 3 adenylate cyclase